MEMVKFLAYFDGTIDGTFTSVVDAYFNCVKWAGYEGKLDIACDPGDLPALHDSLRKDVGLSLNEVTIVQRAPACELLVASWRALPMSSRMILGIGDYNANTIFLDSSAPFVHMKRLDEWLKTVPGSSLSLCNPATIKAVKGRIKTAEYYHPFSDRRLEYISHRAWEGAINLADHDKNRGKKSYNPHTCHVKYKRHWMYETGMYENIGKLMFECLLRGGTAEYSPALKTADDGLTHYLRKSGIDDSIEQVIMPTTADLSWALPGRDDNLVKTVETLSRR